MPSWLDLRANKEKYPDDMTIEVGGEKMTLGEYRKEMGPVSDFTKQTQKLSQEREQAQAAYQQAQQELMRTKYEMQAIQQQRQQVVNAGDDPLNPYRQDAAFSPLVSYYDKQLAEMKAVIQQQAQHLQQASTAVNSWRFGMQLEKLKEKDPDLNTQELAAFTTDLYTKGPDVEAAYRLKTYDQQLKRATEEAEKRGYERAKAEPPAPPSPGGRRGGARSNEPALPKDLNGRVALAMQDGELMRNLEQGLQELNQG